MKDALGHGSAAHSAGIVALPANKDRNPRGGVAKAASYANAAANPNIMEDTKQYYLGVAAHASGGSAKDTTGHPEWNRGFAIEQQHQRRDATIAANKVNRATKVRR